MHTGTRCPLLCLVTRSRPWTQAPRHGYLIAAWLVEKNVFTLILVPCEYHARVPFQVWMLSKKLLRYYPQNWVLIGEQNNPNSKLGCFWQVAHTAVQHCLEGVGKESFIFPFEIGNMPKKPFEAQWLYFLLPIEGLREPQNITVFFRNSKTIEQADQCASLEYAMSVFSLFPSESCRSWGNWWTWHQWLG